MSQQGNKRKKDLTEKEKKTKMIFSAKSAMMKINRAKVMIYVCINKNNMNL